MISACAKKNTFVVGEAERESPLGVKSVFLAINSAPFVTYALRLLLTETECPLGCIFCRWNLAKKEFNILKRKPASVK